MINYIENFFYEQVNYENTIKDNDDTNALLSVFVLTYKLNKLHLKRFKDIEILNELIDDVIETGVLYLNKVGRDMPDITKKGRAANSYFNMELDDLYKYFCANGSCNAGKKKTFKRKKEKKSNRNQGKTSKRKNKR